MTPTGKLRCIARRLRGAVAATFLAVVVAGLGAAWPANAGAVTPAQLPSDPVVALVTDAPPGPFSSGQVVTVDVGPNGVLAPNRRVAIQECRVRPRHPHHPLLDCDPRTIPDERVVTGAQGSFSYPGYIVYALPDGPVLGEGPHRHPVCDLAHQCVIQVRPAGQFGRGTGLLSAPFLVHPTAGDTGIDPGTGTPEVPVALALPVVAAGIFGGVMFARRRRRATETSS